MSDRTNDTTRRDFLALAARTAGAAVALSVFPPVIRKALATPAAVRTGTIQDVQHIVILMQENRSFDHYFGTLRGVRGFGDRHTVPQASGKSVWHQSSGAVEVGPFHLDTRTTNAQRTPATPHSFADAQAAWGQGRLSHWPQFKTPRSMGYFKRDDLPFQFALAEAFTICDAYHCSVTTGTDPNRIVFWSGSNYDPVIAGRGQNNTDETSEPDNLRCWVKGIHPEPGYTYAGNALTWPTIPEVLERAGVSWRIYQDPNNNWTGAMHGCLAFDSFRTARPESPIYKEGMTRWSLDHFADHVKNGTLPQVTWILPPQVWSEHPSPSSPAQGAEFTAKVLSALAANPEVWSKTVFFQCFDENDGLFDHVPPPAPPSFNLDGTLAGKSTLDLRGHYFSDAERKHLDPADMITGTTRPWGLGPRVPMYVVSPWSRGGWVNSQVFDHTSVGRFLERRFGVQIPAISPWHRAICGDLTTCFNFETPNDAPFPALPDVDASATVLAAIQRPAPQIPATPQPAAQEPGVRPSRGIPYDLHVDTRSDAGDGTIELTFRNSGGAGAVFHVYDKLHLDRIPRRYTVESGKALADTWKLFENEDNGGYHLWVVAPNGFLREFKGQLLKTAPRAEPDIELRYDPKKRSVRLSLFNRADGARKVTIRSNAYSDDGPVSLGLASHRRIRKEWLLDTTNNWYDLTVSLDGSGNFERRFAGRVETGAVSTSDPAMGVT